MKILTCGLTNSTVRYLSLALFHLLPVMLRLQPCSNVMRCLSVKTSMAPLLALMIGFATLMPANGVKGASCNGMLVARITSLELVVLIIPEIQLLTTVILDNVLR